VWFWGENNAGQVGDNTTVNKPTPVQITSMLGAIDVQTGNASTIGTRPNGSIWGWGYNIEWNLGDNTTSTRLVPTLR
jgi:alpha-tubulin suppressor-like RCC1 family protein